MGTDKALLRLPSGETMLEHALATAASVASEARIVGVRDRYSGYAWAGAIVEDAFPGHGPLGGIHAALTTSSTDWNLVLAVDTPRITHALLHWLVECARYSNAIVTVPRVGGRFQTLCAIYRKRFEEIALRALHANENKIESLFARLETRVVEECELQAAGFGGELFLNCNTPEELRTVSPVGP